MAGRSTMLWRSDDVPHVLILGSIHVLEGTLPDWVLEVHEGADAVVFEADFREALPPPVMPHGLLLPSLDHELWQMVEGTSRDLGLDAQAVRDLSDQYPLVIGERLAILSLKGAGARFEQGLEGALLERTARPLFLESPPEFYQVHYQDTPLTEQVACLRLTMKHLSELPERFRRAAESWRMGEPEAVLDALGFGISVNFPESLRGCSPTVMLYGFREPSTTSRKRPNSGTDSLSLWDVPTSPGRSPSMRILRSDTAMSFANPESTFSDSRRGARKRSSGSVSPAPSQ